MTQSASQVLLLAVIIGVSGRSREFGVYKPAPRDIPAAALILGGMLLAGRIMTLVSAAMGPVSGTAAALFPELPPPAPPVLSPDGSLSPAAALALSAGFSLASGYREELFYRAYLLGSYRQRGAPPAAAVAVSVVLFAWGHAYQGPTGVAAAAFAGLFLALAWYKGISVHALAWGHAGYNLGILLTLSQLQTSTTF
jgi:membrane protease YdiL (CAAX protease family)